jgi:hypothetical protein
MHEMIADALRDAAERAHRTWDHHHAFGQERTRRQRRAHVAR